MNTLDSIKKTIETELKQFNVFLEDSLKSSTPLLNKILKYVLKQKGKQIRPLFVLLSAKCHGEINENTYRAAAFIELLHTATLIHDDVVDNSDKRRGMFSLNALWKNKIAVLIGDYLLSKGMLLALQNKDYQMLDTISETVKAMSEGEIYQMEKARRMDITEEDYYDIIRGKTASLISSCCVVGALSVNATESQVEKMRKFGTSAGIAFQIKDDIFDYQINNKTGKPAGNDIQEHKMTLPLIHLLKISDKSERRSIIRKIKYHSDEVESRMEIIEKVHQNHCLDYAEEKMNVFVDEALSQLDEIKNEEALASLKALVNYCIKREK
ncbi:MAG: polyprenyl synthetase family protein [Bacteroidales bacterium]|nr:polyprenyl synthetase family protein [Bacteroidales bacterium]